MRRIAAILKKYLIFAFFYCLCHSAIAATASYNVNIQDMDVKDFIYAVADITKRDFIIDPKINGQVTVISNKPLNEDEIYQLFLSVLQVNGIAAIENNGIVKLVPNTIAKQLGIPYDSKNTAVGNMMVTRVIYLEGSQPQQIQSVIQPLLPQSATVAIVPGVNALVLTDTADSLNQIGKLIDALDKKHDEKVTTIYLQHVDPQRMVELIQSLTEQTNQPNTQGISSTSLIADSSADRLIVKGSDEVITKIKELVAKLDTPPSKRLSGLRVFHLDHANAEQMADILRDLLTVTQEGNSNAQAGDVFSIIADKTRNSLIVNGPPSLINEVEQTIKTLDKRRDQILIQAAILELSGTNADQLGVQWVNNNSSIGYGVVNLGNPGVNLSTFEAALGGAGSDDISAQDIAGLANGTGITIGAGNASNSEGNNKFYGAILQALGTEGNAKLLSTPSVLTVDNQKASILVGQNLPFVTGAYATGANGVNPFQTIERKDVGIILSVIPHIGAEGTIRLEVAQEVSSVIPSNQDNVNGLSTNKRIIKTTVLAEDQQTIALGGLLQDDSTIRQTAVPGLSDVPVVGALFRSKSKSNTKRNLIIFLQPTIIKNGNVPASVTQRYQDPLSSLHLTINPNGSLSLLPTKN